MKKDTSLAKGMALRVTIRTAIGVATDNVAL